MIIRLREQEAQAQFPQLLDRVHQGDQVVVVESSGKPMAALIPAELYAQLIAEREARFQVLDRIRQRLPDVPPSEVEQDVAEAIAEVTRSMITIDFSIWRPS